MKKILITGGAGFIGSHVVKYFLAKYPNYHIYNIDILSYAGNLDNLRDVKNNVNYTFLRGDISDSNYVNLIFDKYKFDSVINLAAETHVDKSINEPLTFLETNVRGTVVLLNACKKFWKSDFSKKLFYHISTDEVYGSVEDINDFFKETTAYSPNSPYSASKASSDHFVRAFGETYGIPFIISNCSNNYGPFQFPEKLIPVCINNSLNGKTIPVYGKGDNIRDWLYVTDHVMAIDTIFHEGKNKNNYNIGGNNELKNIEVVNIICDYMDQKTEKKPGTSQKLIKFVDDRPGHDKRYAIDTTKIVNELSWSPGFSFDVGISKTIDWYLENQEWLSNIKSKKYK